jgi:hypothetical protein
MLDLGSRIMRRKLFLGPPRFRAPHLFMGFQVDPALGDRRTKDRVERERLGGRESPPCRRLLLLSRRRGVGAVFSAGDRVVALNRVWSETELCIVQRSVSRADGYSG